MFSADFIHSPTVFTVTSRKVEIMKVTCILLLLDGAALAITQSFFF